jgi:hypothetical protein
MLTLSNKRFDDKGKYNEGEIYNIQLVIAGTDSSVALDAPEKSLNFIAFFIQIFVIIPRLQAVGIGWHDWGVPPSAA